MPCRWPLAFALALSGCTLSHPLDQYGDEYGLDAGASDAGAADTARPPEAAAACVGIPKILEPTVNENVGASIHLRVTAPSCLHSMIAYLDDKEILRVADSTIDQWVPVTVGKHTVNVNGWTGGEPAAHVSVLIAFTRPN